MEFFYDSINPVTVNKYFNDLLSNIFCDALDVLSRASQKEKNNFVSINISEEVEKFIKDTLKYNTSILSRFCEIKSTSPSYKDTLEFEFNSAYKKYKRLQNATN